MSLHTLPHVHSFNVIVSYLGLGQPPLQTRLITFYNLVYLCIYNLAGFVRRGYKIASITLNILVYLCIYNLAGFVPSAARLHKSKLTAYIFYLS